MLCVIRHKLEKPQQITNAHQKIGFSFHEDGESPSLIGGKARTVAVGIFITKELEVLP
jgi:hypothetical protein